jgi:uncharacterized membrane protein
VRGRLAALWARLRGSLWLLPSVIVAGAVIAAVALVEIDSGLAPGALDAWPRLFGAGADGARAMLTTIAGSMITVAGVTFSMTMVVLSLTSSQYTSRVLRTFLEDRGNQAVLGVFLGIYAYCLVVLRTIRGGDEVAFVPSLSVLFAVGLALVGIAVLIRFIHHVSHGIRASHIVAGIASETRSTLDRLHRDVDEEQPAHASDPAERTAWIVVTAGTTGYIQHVDTEALQSAAASCNAWIRIDVRVGDFVIEDVAFARVAGAADPAPLRDALRRAMVVGKQRSIVQDAAFGFRQIVDVALKALSPASNDSTTGRICLDYLGALLVHAARRVPLERRDGGAARVTMPRHTFADLVDLTLDEIRVAARDNAALLGHVVDMVATVARVAPVSARSHLRVHLDALEGSLRTIDDERERALLDAHLVRARQAIG